MRTYEEVGRIRFNEETNEAYRTYASVYLDMVDDNMRHFIWRDIDIRPIIELEEKGEEVTDKTVKAAYLDAAKDILETSSLSLAEIIKEYPLMENIMKDGAEGN